MYSESIRPHLWWQWPGRLTNVSEALKLTKCTCVIPDSCTTWLFTVVSLSGCVFPPFQNSRSERLSHGWLSAASCSRLLPTASSQSPE